MISVTPDTIISTLKRNTGLNFIWYAFSNIVVLNRKFSTNYEWSISHFAHIWYPSKALFEPITTRIADSPYHVWKWFILHHTRQTKTRQDTTVRRIASSEWARRLSLWCEKHCISTCAWAVFQENNAIAILVDRAYVLQSGVFRALELSLFIWFSNCFPSVNHWNLAWLWENRPRCTLIYDPANWPKRFITGYMGNAINAAEKRGYCFSKWTLGRKNQAEPHTLIYVIYVMYILYWSYWY